MAGRAAVWSSTASDIDSLVLQESIEREQLESDLEAVRRRGPAPRGPLRRRPATASALRDRADALRATDPRRAARADLDAQAAWDMDLALWPFFRTTIPTYDDDGRARVRRAGRRSRRAPRPIARLSELRRSQTPARAQAARDQTLTLVGVAVLFVAALFVLTLAEVWPGRSRWAPLLVGLALAAGATAVTVAVEPATALLIAGIVAVAAVVLAVALVGPGAAGTGGGPRGRGRRARAGARARRRLGALPGHGGGDPGGRDAPRRERGLPPGPGR